MWKECHTQRLILGQLGQMWGCRTEQPLVLGSSLDPWGNWVSCEVATQLSCCYSQLKPQLNMSLAIRWEMASTMTHFV